MASPVFKRLPLSEQVVPGVYCRTVGGLEYQITSDADHTRFTLWKMIDGGLERIARASSPYDLYEKIPWDQ